MSLADNYEHILLNAICLYKAKNKGIMSQACFCNILLQGLIISKINNFANFQKIKRTTGF